MKKKIIILCLVITLPLLLGLLFLDAGPGLISAETVNFSATCPVPVDVAQLILEIGTDSCVGGCDEWGWTSEIDPSFLESFE